jgi:hypothetical protein
VGWSVHDRGLGLAAGGVDLRRDRLDGFLVTPAEQHLGPGRGEVACRRAGQPPVRREDQHSLAGEPTVI